MQQVSDTITWLLPEGFDAAAICREIDKRSYVVIENAISAAEADAVRVILAAIAAQEEREDHRKNRHQRVGELLRKDPVFIDLLSHPIVTAVWRAYCGPDMICSTWTANIIQPGHDQIGWHVDYPYWSVQAPFPDCRLAGQSLWALDDFTVDNGATGTVPGSHLRRHPPTQRDQDPADAVVLTAPRGSLVLADGGWWHTSRPNRTAAPRHALLGMYMRKFVIPQEDMRAQVEALPEASTELRGLCGGDRYRPTIITG